MVRPGPRPRPPSRAEVVAGAIEDELLADRLPVGAHLGRRADVMARFGVSPTVMSEVLRILRTRGLVAVRPGTGGGLFVASEPPQVRLGGMDLWFHPSPTHPLDLFEARVHLESVLTPAAFDRAGPDDVAALERIAGQLDAADDAGAYLRAVMALHRALATASGITVLVGVHDALVAALESTLSRAVWVDGHEEALRHSRQVHTELVTAIAGRDRARFAKVSRLHDADLVRAGDPRRSPHPAPEPGGDRWAGCAGSA